MNHAAVRRVACLAGVIATLGCVTANAQELPPRAFEITPYVSWRTGGDFEIADTDEEVDLDDHGAFALALNLRLDELSQYELFYGRQSTSLEGGSTLGDVDADVEYLHIGGTLVVNENPRWKPYIIGTLGATRFSPDVVGGSDDTRFSISLGGGMRVPFSTRFSLRLEARGFVTFVDTDSAVFCRSNEEGGLCRIRGSGSTFIQYEILAGAAFAF